MNRKLKKLLELYDDDELEQLLLKNAKEDNTSNSNSSEDKKEDKDDDYNHDRDSKDEDLKSFIAKAIKELISQKDQDQDQKEKEKKEEKDQDQKEKEKKEEKDHDQKEKKWIPSNSTNADLFKPKKFQCIT